MKKIGYLALVVFVVSVIGFSFASAKDKRIIFEQYAVGGELIPITTTPFLFSPSLLAVIAVAAAIVVAAAALSDKLGIEVLIDR